MAPCLSHTSAVSCCAAVTLTIPKEELTDCSNCIQSGKRTGQTRQFAAQKCFSSLLEWFSKPNIRFGSGRTRSNIVSKFRLTHNRKLRSANRNTMDHTIACPALLLWCPAVENRGPCVPGAKKCSLSNCASPGDSFCQVLDHWWSHGQHLVPIHSLMMAMYLPKISCRSKKTHRQAGWMEASIWPCQTSGGVRHGVSLTKLRSREKNCRIPDKGATGLQKAGFAIGMRSNRIENSIRFGAWSTETFGRFGRVFRFNFRSRARSTSETVEPKRNSVC